MYLNLQSLLGLTTLVAAFLNSSKRGPMHGTVASLWGEPKSGKPHFLMGDTKKNAGNTGLAPIASAMKLEP